MSSRTRSGSSSTVFASASSPSAASPMTEKPSASSSARAVARKLGWSSTTRTVLGTSSIVASRRESRHTASRTPRWVSPCHLAAESRAAADSEPLLERSVFLPVLLRRPHEQGRDEDRDRDHEHGHQDLGREIHQISASGKLRCRRGGTRKFWRWVVRSTELKPWFRSRDSSGSFPSGSTPSIARRLRWKSSLVGLKTTKWIPAAGPLASSEG